MLYYTSLFGATGLWRNWLAHWTVDPGVAGSSPVDPANLKRKAFASWCNGSTADSDSACWGSSPCEATNATTKKKPRSQAGAFLL